MKYFFKSYSRHTLDSQKIEDAIAILERETSEKLDFTFDEKGKAKKIDFRVEFIEKGVNSEEFKTKNIPLIANANLSNMISFSGNYLSKYFFASTEMWYIVVRFDQNEALSLKLPLLVSDVLKSYWSTLSGEKAEREFALQGQPYHISTNGLPKLPPPDVYDSPYIPANLGWLNYWPALTLKRINFQEEHRALFYKVEPAANDGLILQITAEPLDLDKEEHLRKTVAIYDALPAIGGRDCV